MLITRNIVESIAIVLHRFDDQQRGDMRKILKDYQNLLDQLGLKLDKFQVLANDSSPDWKSRVRTGLEEEYMGSEGG